MFGTAKLQQLLPRYFGDSTQDQAPQLSPNATSPALPTSASDDSSPTPSTSPRAPFLQRVLPQDPRRRKAVYLAFGGLALLVFITGIVKGTTKKSSPGAGNLETAADLSWSSEGGTVQLNGETFHLKGVSWFGMEDSGQTPHGLDKVSAEDLLTFLRDNDFNAVRLPISLEFALDLDAPITNYGNLEALKDEDLHRLTRGQLLSKIVDKCGEHGLVVLLDMHRLNMDMQSDQWYDDKHPQQDWIQGWEKVLELVKDKWNIMGIDLFNEPRGKTTWGTGNKETDWALAVAEISNHIFKKFPKFNGVLFVQGVENPTGTPSTSGGRWWGGSIEGVHQDPINLHNHDWNKRIVYSPHVYGPSIFQQEYFKSEEFPKNMPNVFEEQWCFAQHKTGRAVVIGEWGGSITTNPQMREWASALVDFLINHCSTGNFYWSLNPDSTDTGGLLEMDWVTPEQDKLDLLKRLQPHPSRVERVTSSSDKTGTYRFNLGEWANSKCSAEPPAFLDLNPDHGEGGEDHHHHLRRL